MQNECFSLPVNKATMTLFFIQMEQKIYIYIYLYINISMQMSLGRRDFPLLPARWNKDYGTPFKSTGPLEKGAERTTERRGLAVWGWTTSMHAPIIYWTPQKKQSLPNICSLSPPSSTLLSWTLVSTFAIWSIFISIITYTKSKGDVLLDKIQ